MIHPIHPIRVPLTMRRITQTWWPLAAGWLLMTIEIPAISAIVARNPEPEINLAGWGVVFSVALMLASPVMMMLSASTAYCKDWSAYQLVRSYTWWITGGLTFIHALVAFTPLYNIIVRDIIAAPPEILEGSRLGFITMLPYIPALAYRRFNYGVLIRFGHTRSVTIGAASRIVVDVIVLLLLYIIGGVDGLLIASITFTAGVVGEAIYSGIRVQRVLHTELPLADPSAQPLSFKIFSAFYVPLVLTSVLQILVQPIGTAALSRMPDPIQSLAVWPVVYGLVIMWTSAGMAFTEAVVILLDQPRAVEALQRFTIRIGLIMVGGLLVMNATPLSDIWFANVAALPPDLAPVASWALWCTLLLPGMAFLQSWYTGALMNDRRTRGITEAVVAFLVANILILWVGIAWGKASGLLVGTVAMVVGHVVRTAWLWYRTRPAMRRLQAASASSIDEFAGATTAVESQGTAPQQFAKARTRPN